MTYAICIKCGEGKFGAFVPCTRCGFAPTSSSDQARSIVLSDHNSDEATLDDIGKQLKAGEVIEYDEPGIARMAAELEEIARHPPSTPLGCRVIVWVLLGTVIVLIVLLVGSIWYIRSH